MHKLKLILKKTSDKPELIDTKSINYTLQNISVIRVKKKKKNLKKSSQIKGDIEIQRPGAYMILNFILNQQKLCSKKH